jgi:phosphoadenosine phosphosulfate reductase
MSAGSLPSSSSGPDDGLLDPMPGAAVADRAQVLTDRYRDADDGTLLAALIEREFAGRIALVSSFGAEAAVLLHMVATVDPSIPVVFLDTGKLFGETRRYRDQLTALLGLTDVRAIGPDPKRLDTIDPDGVLWYGNPDMCCHIRKVEPLAQALEGFEAWITGRKGFHGGERSGLARIEGTEDGRIKVNPLAGWSRSRIEAYFSQFALPRHPLEADGYLSIGCMPCTDRVRPGEDIRAGRWRGREKTECGIHRPIQKWRMIGID